MSFSKYLQACTAVQVLLTCCSEARADVLRLQALAWKVASYFPGITLFMLTALNVVIHRTGSSGAIPLGAFFSLIALWFIISIPLCFSGTPPVLLAAAAHFDNSSRQQSHLPIQGACQSFADSRLVLVQEACWPPDRRSSPTPHAPTRYPAMCHPLIGPPILRSYSWPLGSFHMAPSLWRCTLP